MKKIPSDCGRRNPSHRLRGSTFPVIFVALVSLYPSMSQSASQDSNPSSSAQSTTVLVEPGEFFWRVNSISLEWKVQKASNVETKSATSWSFENSSEFVNAVKLGTKQEAGGGVDLSLGIFPIANASIYAKAGVWAEARLAWGSSQQKKAKECSESFKSSSVQKSNQQVSFSIGFYNKSTNDYEIINATIPICIKGNEHTWISYDS